MKWVRKHPWAWFGIKWSLAAAAVFYVMVYVIGFYVVRGETMAPQMHDGDLLILYRGGSFCVGDVVCYRTKDNQKRISRIAAVDGQEVNITETGWYLDGFVPSETCFYETRPDPESAVLYPHRVCGYFVMDDQRTIGADSRSSGDLSRDQILGKVIFLLRVRGW